MSTEQTIKQNEDTKKQAKEANQMVSVKALLSFFPTFSTKLLFVTGIFAGIVNGLAYPFLAYLCKYNKYLYTFIYLSIHDALTIYQKE